VAFSHQPPSLLFTGWLPTDSWQLNSLTHQLATWRHFTQLNCWQLTVAESESCVTTDSQSANVSWNKAPIWGSRPDFYYCQSVAGLLMWSALSDERTGLSFTIAAGPRQRSRSRVRVPSDSRPCFTLSDLRLPFSLSPTTRRATVEAFHHAARLVASLYNTGPDPRENTASNNPSIVVTGGC
jgi:hypothetical protein